MTNTENILNKLNIEIVNSWKTKRKMNGMAEKGTFYYEFKVEEETYCVSESLITDTISSYVCCNEAKPFNFLYTGTNPKELEQVLMKLIQNDKQAN